MSTEFTVDVERLDNLVARLAGLAGYLTEQLDLIDDKVATLDGAWETVAANAYRDAHRLWSTGAREFATGLADISDAARTAHTRYTTAAEVNRKMLDGA
ncbi:WXG100 family type VII secretion target [Nocardia sp. NPDC001965]|uniref:WXG100 family type VII secretion target n=1 Tax=Nocardia rhamnosiphila TaxID=426716 RepID=UPI0004C466D5|nr:WXG100 family type VII secretion target [Nocardia rhamnosiphila]